MSVSTATSHEQLSRHEAKDLTIELGSQCVGDDYDNPEVWGTIAHFKTTDWKHQRYQRDSEHYDNQVRTQIERLQEVIAPYVGRTAIGVTKSPSFEKKNEENWEQWSMTAPCFAKGRILGIEGHPVLTRKFFDSHYYGYRSREIAPGRRWPGYRIGVVIDTSMPESYMNHNMSTEEELAIPSTSRVLVPVRRFPRSEICFHHLFSDQIKSPRRF